MKKEQTPPRSRLYVTIAGTILVAVCCFATIMAVTFGATGLSALTPYFYYVLFPALAALVIFIYLPYRKWKDIRKRQ